MEMGALLLSFPSPFCVGEPSWTPETYPSGKSLGNGLYCHPQHGYHLVCSPQSVEGMLELWVLPFPHYPLCPSAWLSHTHWP